MIIIKMKKMKILKREETREYKRNAPKNVTKALMIEKYIIKKEKMFSELGRRKRDRL